MQTVPVEHSPLWDGLTQNSSASNIHPHTCLVYGLIVKKHWLISLLLLSSECAIGDQDVQYHPQVGDLVFQSLPRSDLMDAIEGVSQSPYSHVGLVVQKNNAWYVREAYGVVHDTPLQEWIGRGRQQRFDAHRLKSPWPNLVPSFAKESEAFLGRPSDYKYSMDDAQIYCSEFICKSMLSAAGARVRKVERLSGLLQRKRSRRHTLSLDAI